MCLFGDSFLENCLCIDGKKQCRLAIFGDIVLKIERECVQCCDLAPLCSPAIATIICSQSNTGNLFSGKKTFFTVLELLVTLFQ